MLWGSVLAKEHRFKEPMLAQSKCIADLSLRA